MSEREWIARIEDRFLREDIRRQVIELIMLSEVPAYAGPRTATPDGKLLEGRKARRGKIHKESEPPRGVSINRRPGQAPSKDDSFYSHFLFRYERAQTDLEFEVIYEEAKRDLKKHKDGLEDGDMARNAYVDEQRDTRELLAEEEGVPAAVVAVKRGWPIAWVRTIRQRNERDAELGLPRPRWRELSDQERRDVCEGYAYDEGLNQTQAAKRLGIAQSTVSPYWPKRELRAA